MTIYFLIHDGRKEYSIVECVKEDEKFDKKTNHPIRYYDITRYIDIREYWAQNMEQLTPEIKEYLIEGFNLKDYKLTTPVKRNSHNYYSQKKY